MDSPKSLHQQAANAEQEAEDARAYRIWQAEEGEFVTQCSAARIAIQEDQEKIQSFKIEVGGLSQTKEASLPQLREMATSILEMATSVLLQIEELEKKEVENNAQLQDLELWGFKLNLMRKDSIKAIASDEFKDALEWCEQSKKRQELLKAKRDNEEKLAILPQIEELEKKEAENNARIRDLELWGFRLNLMRKASRMRLRVMN